MDLWRVLKSCGIPSRSHGCFNTKSWLSMTWMILGYLHVLETSSWIISFFWCPWSIHKHDNLYLYQVTLVYLLNTTGSNLLSEQELVPYVRITAERFHPCCLSQYWGFHHPWFSNPYESTIVMDWQTLLWTLFASLMCTKRVSHLISIYYIHVNVI